MPFIQKKVLVWLANWYWHAAAKLSSTSTSSVTTPTTFEEIVLIKPFCITKWKSNFRSFGSEWFESKWFLGSLVNQINQMRAGLLLYKCGQERAEREINYDGSLGKRIFYTLRMKLPNGLKYIFQMFTWYPFIKKCKIFFVFHALALKYDTSFRCLRRLHCARSLSCFYDRCTTSPQVAVMERAVEHTLRCSDPDVEHALRCLEPEVHMRTIEQYCCVLSILPLKLEVFAAV